MPETDLPVLLPEIIEEHLGAGTLALALRIPENLTYFSGHFPGTPIVPGVVQIHWAVHYARQSLGIRLPFHRMEAVKFKGLVLPGQRLTLALHWFAPAHKLEFNFRSENREHSSGRIYFKGYDV
ncbi:MAG: AMP-dependent synthetase [Proteobacteria bacterium]|nr:AMP-dependent synthetase [Pseudomonadota bacterium]